MASNIDSLPKLDLLLNLNSSSILPDLDPDLNLPQQTNFGYYSTSDFKNSYKISNCTSNNHFSILHSNIQSLNANFDSLLQMLAEISHSFSLIGLTETKYKISEEVLSNHAIPGYSFVSQPSLSNAGGAGFFVSDKLNFTVRDDLSESTPDYECLWIEVQSDSKDDLICGVIYRHPHSNLEAFMAYLDIVMDKISRERKYCVMMGDFNLNLLNADSHPGTNEFLNTLGSYFFNPHILQPTRITHHTATLIDNVFFNSISHHTISGNILYDLTDHLPNFLIINKFSALPKGFKIFKRDFSLFNEQNFLQEMQSVNWNLESLDDNVNEMFDTFNSELMKIIDKHIPLKQLSRKDVKHVKHRSKPWITSGIRTSLKIKNNLYKKYIKSRTVYYHQKFKLYRNKINRLI